MSFDARHSSLSEHIRSLSLAPDLKDILAVLADRTEPPPAPDRGAEFTEMLDRARPRIPAPRPPAHARPKRDHPHLRVLPVLAALTAGAGAALSNAAWWLARSGARKAAVLAAGGVLAGGAIVAAPALTPGVPSGPDVVRVVPVPGPVLGGRHPRVPPAAQQPVVARRRRRPLRDRDAAGPSPSPSPSPTLPPAPSPSPSPSPSCAHPGKHCGTGSPAFTALIGLAWDDMPAPEAMLP